MMQVPHFGRVSDMPAPPCEAFACVLYNRCKHEQLACSAFAHYVVTGRAVKPTVIIKRKYGSDKPEDLPHGHEILPTREQYDRIYNGSKETEVDDD